MTSANILCIQETHIEGSQIYLLNKLGYRVITASMNGASTKGVAILAKGRELQFGRSASDKYGRWAITECQLSRGTKITICTI